jgi:hypothetical protein
MPSNQNGANRAGMIARRHSRNTLGWVLVGWIVLVVSFYLYYMLRSFF